jgi:hypothetical protein
MIEPARRHGPFDLRFPAPLKVAAPRRERSSGADAGLDWVVFVARFFPHSRRQDLEAVAAYAAYRNDPGRDLAPPSAVLIWESEGGALARDADRGRIAGVAG